MRLLVSTYESREGLEPLVGGRDAASGWGLMS